MTLRHSIALYLRTGSPYWRQEGRKTDRERFECVLPALSAEVVDLIIRRNGWDENTAISRFMRSVVYDRLQNESSKTWHFSALLLAELFDDEQNGELEWPEAGRWSPRR